MNRESWLEAAVLLIKEQLFDPREYTLPPITRVSVGLCGGKAIGLCADPDCAEDGSTHLFIDPKLTKPIEVLGTLLHEMVHASVGVECKHKGKFVEVIRELGLEGKPTATFVAPDTELYNTLCGIAMKLGDYPHAALTRKKKDKKPHAWITYVSVGHEDEFMVRANKNTVEEFGPPLDPWGEKMVPKNPEDREDADDEKLDLEIILKPGLGHQEELGDDGSDAPADS